MEFISGPHGKEQWNRRAVDRSGGFASPRLWKQMTVGRLEKSGLLTPPSSARIVWFVFLNLRQLISSTLIVILLAGGAAPYVACSTAVCAARQECVSVHCSCCGSNYPWQKTSHESHRDDSHSNQDCPLIATTKVVTASNAQPLSAVTLSGVQVQPFLIADSNSYTIPVRHSATLDPPTLLRLACSLTI